LADLYWGRKKIIETDTGAEIGKLTYGTGL